MVAIEDIRDEFPENIGDLTRILEERRVMDEECLESIEEEKNYDVVWCVSARKDRI